MNKKDDIRSYNGEFNYHEEFFLEQNFKDNHQNLIKDYLKYDKIILFYPGTGMDIFVPMKYLFDIVDEFYFNDIIYPKEILSDRFKEYLKFNGFQIIDCYTESVDRLRKISYVLNYKDKQIKFDYFHCSWHNLLKWFKKNNIKISFLYLYGIGGEGGSAFLDVYDITSNNWKELIDILTNRFIAIYNGKIYYRDIGQYTGDWSYMPLNNVTLSFKRDNICDHLNNFDGIVISKKMYKYNKNYNPDKTNIKKLEEFSHKLFIYNKWNTSDAYMVMKKIFDVIKLKKWNIIATTVFGGKKDKPWRNVKQENHMGIFKAIKEWDGSPVKVTIFYLDNNDLYDLRTGSLIELE